MRPACQRTPSVSRKVLPGPGRPRDGCVKPELARCMRLEYVLGNGSADNVGMSRQAPRALTPRERSVLDRLLGAEFPGAAEFRDQADDAVVVGRCDCGCPSIDLAVLKVCRLSPVPDGPVQAELRVTPMTGEPEGDVILFAKDGRLGCLEYVYYTNAPPSAWPVPSHLRLVLKSRIRAHP